MTLVCSQRKRGNSELIGRLAVGEAKRRGTDAELLRLGDYSLLQCDGCMRCVFNNEPCHLQDDVYQLFDAISRADSLLLVSPTYVLSIPGMLKLAIDRYLLMDQYHPLTDGHWAASIGVAGLRGWEQFELPLLNLLLLGLGFRILDSFMLYGAGPGEALLNSSAIGRIQTTVSRLSSRQPSEPYGPVISDHCPICFSTLFEKIEPGKFRCPVCLSLGEERKEGFYFSSETLRDHRFTPERMKSHLQDWVLSTKGDFRKKLPQILRVVKQFGL